MRGAWLAGATTWPGRAPRLASCDRRPKPHVTSLYEDGERIGTKNVRSGGYSWLLLAVLLAILTVHSSFMVSCAPAHPFVKARLCAENSELAWYAGGGDSHGLSVGGETGSPKVRELAFWRGENTMLITIFLLQGIWTISERSSARCSCSTSAIAIGRLLASIGTFRTSAGDDLAMAALSSTAPISTAASTTKTQAAARTTSELRKLLCVLEGCACHYFFAKFGRKLFAPRLLWKKYLLHNMLVHTRSCHATEFFVRFRLSCLYLHRVAGDVERRYHPRYYKTAMCVYETDANGFCVRNGAHCAYAHGNEDLREPIFETQPVQILSDASSVRSADGDSIGSSIRPRSLSLSSSGGTRDKPSLEDVRWGG